MSQNVRQMLQISEEMLRFEIKMLQVYPKMLRRCYWANNVYVIRIRDAAFMVFDSMFFCTNSQRIMNINIEIIKQIVFLYIFLHIIEIRVRHIILGFAFALRSAPNSLCLIRLWMFRMSFLCTLSPRNNPDVQFKRDCGAIVARF